jgi:hypothetical protein
LREINKLRNDFRAIKFEALPADNTDVINIIDQTRKALIARIDGIRINGDTNINEEVIQQLIALRKQIAGSYKQPVATVPQPIHRPEPRPIQHSRGCQYGECCDRPEEIERTITEKIRRN